MRRLPSLERSVKTMTFHYPILRTYRWVRAGIEWGKYQADLGESLDESISRYGPVVHIGNITSYYPQYEFEIDAMDVSIAYENGRAIRVWHSSERAIPDEDVERGLAAYGLEQDWTVLKDVPANVAGLFSFGRSQPGTHYQRRDKEAWACVGGRGRDLNHRTFHFDIVCGRWARVHPTQYGVWSVNNRPKTEQVAAGQPATRPDSK